MDWKTLAKNKWLLAIAAIGMLLLLIGSFFPPQKAKPTVSAMTSGTGQENNSTETSDNGSSNTPTQAALVEQSYDQQLEQILGQIQGINAVTVMVTVDSTGTLKVAQNRQSTKTANSGGSTTTTENDQVYSANNGEGDSSPFVVGNEQPSVRGVLVTVNADDFATAKAEIIESITNVLDVPAYKISVEPQKEN
ncbi:hypothetical protein [Alicyclobacillus fodiniaquatilis]|uniref:Stage III sporulation protein AG n=1 Tax=Alicyclobacillus fodiniaquatilis TaxID=1661150 RepID=A0ABW4JGB5_9BACL